MAERLEERALQKAERKQNSNTYPANQNNYNNQSKKTNQTEWSLPNVGHNEEKTRLIDLQDLQQTNTKHTIKSLLKDKISQAIQKKEDDHTIKQLHITFPQDKPSYNIELLDENPYKDSQIDEERLLEKAEAVKNKLQEFGIEVEIDGCNIWPTVLQIKIKPSAWVKITKIEWFKKDIALALKTKSLRILAPIPWTECVWIEIPNPKPQMIKLRDVIWSVWFTQSMQDNRTNLTIGKDISGNYLVKSLEEMPHLLVAWATWSGKSVWVNDFILSLIYQNTPAELKFIMVDPKQVELSIYEGIPYLLSPIITEPQKAIKVLKRTVEEMEKRYTLLKHKSSRNLIEYNQKVDNSLQMYRLVVIIDELADLMMSGNKKDTENYITRIAQKARAVGIHLIVATQRPSVDVITWLIKANIPTRIAFGVVSQVDSRTILDMIGAEDLVGKWDLLYMDPKTKYPVRVQWPFVSTAETELIVKAIKSKYMNNISEQDIYHPEIIRILESKWETAWSWGDVSDTDEELINQAIEIISETRKASATMLQRKLGIGFPRAARLIDIMEERGIIGPQEGAKAREILI
jgi:DNA segregation ATPase FtsK/SpoIIIE, S-DNA-T family